MALSPSIPTSFVPKQPVGTGRRRYSRGTNLFLVVAVAIFIISIVLAGAAFLYGTYLQSVEKSKAAQVSAAEQRANAANVNDFVRLRDRLAASSQIINQHITLSQFFTLLESITVQDVQYNSLDIIVNPDRSAFITMKGRAGSINALAAESTSFAQQKLIKDAVFSGISVNSDGTVSFSIDASLDPSLITETKAPATAPLMQATNTASTSTPPVQTVNTSPLPDANTSTSTPSK